MQLARCLQIKLANSLHRSCTFTLTCTHSDTLHRSYTCYLASYLHTVQDSCKAFARERSYPLHLQGSCKMSTRFEFNTLQTQCEMLAKSCTYILAGKFTSIHEYHYFFLLTKTYIIYLNWQFYINIYAQIIQSKRFLH